MLAPICLFTYNRINETIQTVKALQENFLAEQSDLYIFSDGPKNIFAEKKVDAVRSYIHSLDGFKSINIIESDQNKGLANSIIEGVTKIINQHGKLIVLEDDLVTSRNFLQFINQGLTFFESDTDVFSIAGYTPPIRKPKQDIYFTQRASSWGWATWKDRWNEISWNIENYESYRKDLLFIKKFNRMGSDMSKMLHDQMTGKINSWAIRWCFHQYLKQKFTVYPTVSKIQNIGTGQGASHTIDRFNRFATPLDLSLRTDFDFNVDVKLESFYLKQFLKQFSIATRIKYKLLNSLKS